MKRFWVVWILLLLCAGFAGWGINQAYSQQTGPSEETIKLTLLPGNTLKQGSILMARLETPTPLPENVTAKVDGRTGRFFEQSPGVYEALFGISVDAKPGEHQLAVTAPNGTTLAKAAFTVLNGQFRRQNISVSKGTKGLQALPGELEAVQALKVNVTPIRYWQKPLISPTPDCQNSPFGVKRYHNGVYTQDYHKGVDLRSPHGRPIRAIADGVVKIAAPQFRLHGGTVGLDHGQGLNSIYIHLSKVAVKPGDSVKKGDIIGYVGATGFATGPHLHWGLYANGVPVNPDVWIPVPRC